MGEIAPANTLLFVNGFGGTPLPELYLAYGIARRFLEARNVPVQRSLVGTYVTSLDMAGCSLTLLWLDDTLQPLHDAPASTPAFTRIGASYA